MASGNFGVTQNQVCLGRTSNYDALLRESPARRRQPRDNSKLDFQSSLLPNSRIDFNLPNWWGEAPERLGVLAKRLVFTRRKRIVTPETSAEP